jgi:uncharacterized protein YcbK (DUF882 family)
MTKGSNVAAPASSQAADSKAAAAQQKPVIFSLQAVHDTWLKKSTDPAAELPDDEKVLVPAGKQLGVVAATEIQGNAHELVELGGGAGTWHAFMPHFKRLQGVAPAGLQAAALLLPAAVAHVVAEEIDWSDFGAFITSNLTVGEVLQFDARRRPTPQSAVVPRILETAREFQAIRQSWGHPLGVTSFYRPEPINREVGGVPNSFHVSGMAVDLYPVGLPLQALYDFLITRWTGGFGDGRNRGFIHIDRRNGGRFVPSGGVRPAAIWPY